MVQRAAAELARKSEARDAPYSRSYGPYPGYATPDFRGVPDKDTFPRFVLPSHSSHYEPYPGPTGYATPDFRNIPDKEESVTDIYLRNMRDRQEEANNVFSNPDMERNRRIAWDLPYQDEDGKWHRKGQ
jgi:hypothetical protein